jgi:hypothetical protein
MSTGVETIADARHLGRSFGTWWMMAALAAGLAPRLTRRFRVEHACHVELIVGATKVSVSFTEASTGRGATQDAEHANIVKCRTCRDACGATWPSRGGARTRRKSEPDIPRHRRITGTKHTGLESRLPFAPIFAC